MGSDNPTIYYKLKLGAEYYQDFRYWKVNDDRDDILNTVFKCDAPFALVAPGYGETKNYGNGAIFVKDEWLIKLDSLDGEKLYYAQLNKEKSTMSEITIEQLIGSYVKLRDKTSEIKAAQKEELKKYSDMEEQLNDLIRAKLNESGADSIKTKEGTAFKKRWVSYKVSDMQSVIEYVKTNDRYDLFEQKVCKSVMDDIVDGVPGVDKEEGIDVQIRRA